MDVFETYKQTGIVEWNPMVDEIAKRTGIAKDICNKVYEAENDILMELGIICDSMEEVESDC